MKPLGFDQSLIKAIEAGKRKIVAYSFYYLLLLIIMAFLMLDLKLQKQGHMTLSALLHKQ